MRANNQSMLWLPVPRSAVLAGQPFPVPAPLRVGWAKAPDASAARTILAELGNARRAGEARTADVRFLPASEAPADLRPRARKPEGYGMTVDAAGIRVWADSAAGQLYAALTLRQLLRQFPRRVPGLRIGDAPALALRGIQLVFPQGHCEYRRAFMRRLVPEIARWKLNALYLYFESYFDFPSLPRLAGPGAMTADNARELDALCRAYHVTLIPVLNLLGHASETLLLQRYAHLAEYPAGSDPRLAQGSNFCPTDPEAQRLVATMLRDAMDAFPGDLIHVGGDEVAMLGKCPRCRARPDGHDPFELYVRHFARLRDLAAKRGRRIGIWGDMLLHYRHEAPPAALARRLAPLRQGTVIHDWHYTGGSADSLAFFTGAGFQTVACSSTALCSLASLWPGQAVPQQVLFAEAVRARALGGMTTAWCNMLGLHEEHLNYLFATGAAALWSGPAHAAPAPDLSLAAFDRAYALQRYGLRSAALTDYWHTLGDAQGGVMRALAPFNGASVRKYLYHTDNVLTFWVRHAEQLRGARGQAYRAGVRRARALWQTVRAEARAADDPYLPLQEGPLLMHEHLVRRLDMGDALYRLYAEAAAVQFRDRRRFGRLMRRAAACLRGHLQDFPPIERYLRAVRRDLGLERASLERLRMTRRKLRELAAFLEHLARSDRPLPHFVELHGLFMQQSRTAWFGIREHEWVAAPPRFRRYTIENGPVWGDGPWAAREPGPHVPVQDFLVSRLQPALGTVADAPYPRRRKALGFTRQTFSTPCCPVHEALFPKGENGLVYFLTRFRCAEAMVLELGLAYDGPVKLWLDRRCVFQDPAGVNPTVPDKACVPFRASRGAHEIMVAFSSNSGRAYEFGVLLKRRDKAGAVLPEVIV